MDANERIVHGTFTNSDETIKAIRRLNEEGYSKDRITVYSNKEGHRSFDATEEKSREEEGSFDITDEDSAERSKEGSFDRIDRESKEDKEDNSDDNSVWESVKDFFTPDTYDYEKESQNPEYNQEGDILYPYRADIAQGQHVIVLNNANMDTGRSL